MRLFFQSIPAKIKSIYILWFIFNFVLLMIEGGILKNNYGVGITINHSSDFFPFGFSFFDFKDYDYTEFLVYTIVPILIYYIYWLWSKNESEKKMNNIISKEIICSKCSASIPFDSKYCTNCGVKLQ